MVIHTWLLLEIIYCFGDKFGCCNTHDGSPNDRRTTVMNVEYHIGNWMMEKASNSPLPLPPHNQ